MLADHRHYPYFRPTKVTSLPASASGRLSVCIYKSKGILAFVRTAVKQLTAISPECRLIHKSRSVQDKAAFHSPDTRIRSSNSQAICRCHNVQSQIHAARMECRIHSNVFLICSFAGSKTVARVITIRNCPFTRPSLARTPSPTLQISFTESLPPRLRSECRVRKNLRGRVCLPVTAGMRRPLLSLLLFSSYRCAAGPRNKCAPCSAWSKGRP